MRASSSAGEKPRPTASWGNAASVLVGDFLYSKAFSLLADIGDIRVVELMSKMTAMCRKAGCFQLMKCGDTQPHEEEYLSIVEKKTAVLISSACESGAALGSAPKSQARALGQYGYNIGMAFQSRTIRWITWPRRGFRKSVAGPGRRKNDAARSFTRCTRCPPDRQKKSNPRLKKKDLTAKTIRNIFEDSSTIRFAAFVR